MSQRDAAASSRGGFTLVELMVVVTILALLAALLVPNLSSIGERARMRQCGSVLHNIGSALAQYVSDNHGYMCSASGVDHLAMETLPCYTDTNGNVQDLRYGAGYSYQNLIAPYLGLGNCMPVNNTVLRGDGSASYFDWPQWVRWSYAKYSNYKQFRCPSGEKGITSPYGWAVDPVNGGRVSSFFQQNCSWASQPQFQCSEWPIRMAYFPKFTDTSKAIILYEFWNCNAMSGDAVCAGQPYTTHFKMGPRGATSIARNVLYADWSVRPINGGSTDEKAPYPRWGGMIIERGNEDGYIFTSPYDGKQYIDWGLGLRFLTAG